MTWWITALICLLTFTPAAFARDGHDKASFSVAYIVRAVTPGHYVSPPATIEDMYRPERFGRTAYGAIDVSPPK